MVRFLLPDAFGLMAFALLAQMAVEQLTDIGIGQSIVREKDGGTPHFLKVAWTVQLIRALCIAAGMLVIAVGLFFLGPYLSTPGSVYGRPEAPVIVAFLSIAAVLHGASSTKIFLAQRQLAFGRISMIQLGSQLVAFVFMLIAVQISPTVWVLLAGALVSSLCRFCLSHSVLPGPRMRFIYDREVSQRLWKFGKWIMASSALNYVSGNADALILGGLLGATTFGIYSVANVWIQGGLQILRKFGSQVGYSAFSETLNKRPEALPDVFGKYMRALSALMLVAAALCYGLAKPFISLLYPENFEEAGLYLQLMAPMLLFLRGLAHSDILMATGNSRAIATASLIRAVAICSFVPVGFALYDVYGAIASAIAARASAFPYIISHTSSLLRRPQVVFEWVWYVMSLATLLIILIF